MESSTGPGHRRWGGVRPYNRPEWVADAVIHVVGLAFGIGACIAVTAMVLPAADPLLLTGTGVYVAGLLCMFGCSALYNLTRDPGRKALFRRLDHAAIFIMIAGTYTPFSLNAIGGAWGGSLLAFVWSVAGIGALAKLACPHRFEWLSIVVYLVLGWSIVVALEPLASAVSIPGLVLLFTGGALYSLGVLFHVWTRLPYHNAIWHGFVLAAAACHFAAVVTEVAVDVG